MKGDEMGAATALSTNGRPTAPGVERREVDGMKGNSHQLRGIDLRQKSTWKEKKKKRANKPKGGGRKFFCSVG